MTAPAIIVAAAEGLREHISAGQYEIGTIAAERSYADWTLPLTEEEVLRVDVVGVLKMAELKLSAQKKLKHLCPISVAVRKKFGPVSQDSGSGGVLKEHVDALMLLTQEIHVRCTPQRLPALPGAVWDSTVLVFAPSHKHLFSCSQFTSLIRVTFRVDQAL